MERASRTSPSDITATDEKSSRSSSHSRSRNTDHEEGGAADLVGGGDLGQGSTEPHGTAVAAVEGANTNKPKAKRGRPFSVAKQGNSKRPKKNKKPKDMPTRPLSAYNLFFREERFEWLRETDQVAALNDKKNDDSPPAEGAIKKKAKSRLFEAMAKALGKRWKELTPNRRKKYTDLAEHDMQRYRLEMERYREKLVKETVVGSAFLKKKRLEEKDLKREALDTRSPDLQQQNREASNSLQPSTATLFASLPAAAHQEISQPMAFSHLAHSNELTIGSGALADPSLQLYLQQLQQQQHQLDQSAKTNLAYSIERLLHQQRLAQDAQQLMALAQQQSPFVNQFLPSESQQDSNAEQQQQLLLRALQRQQQGPLDTFQQQLQQQQQYSTNLNDWLNYPSSQELQDQQRLLGAARLASQQLQQPFAPAETATSNLLSSPTSPLRPQGTHSTNLEALRLDALLRQQPSTTTATTVTGNNPMTMELQQQQLEYLAYLAAQDQWNAQQNSLQPRRS